MHPKTIFMTYKKTVPDIVFKRWIVLNPNYTIDFSLDADCVDFLKSNFNEYVANLFHEIPVGMYKADLWRICKLYVHGGVYADVDLIPHLCLDDYAEASFYSCLSMCRDGIFQAFIKTTPQNPIVLHCIMSFLQNRPYMSANGPCHDMFLCLSENMNVEITVETVTPLKTVKIRIHVGQSTSPVKRVPLYYFPENLHYTVECAFSARIEGTDLIVEHESAWNENIFATILIPCDESVCLFSEICPPGRDWRYCNVQFRGKVLMESRDNQLYDRVIGFK
jgi:Glycosyltransferase sugar-binding region containing DXD motif